MSIIAAAAGGLGAVTGMIGNNQTNKTNIRLQREQQQFNAQQAKQANEWNMQQWQRENEYNAPAQQMARLEAAGLNPNLMYGQGNTGTASKLTAEVPQGVAPAYRDWETDRKSTRLNSSHITRARMPSSA